MDAMDRDIAGVVKLAIKAGYDVEIRVTPTKDGKPGRIQIPWSVVVNLVPRKSET